MSSSMAMTALVTALGITLLHRFGVGQELQWAALLLWTGFFGYYLVKG